MGCAGGGERLAGPVAEVVETQWERETGISLPAVAETRDPLLGRLRSGDLYLLTPGKGVSGRS